ncbi:MAG: ComF family protein, partial [Alphaproteobacteria bacterium]|nr:ComF family protein [Alphaproteobacteria bacterium]
MKKHPKYTAARAVVIYDDMSKKLLLPYKHGDHTDLVPLLTKLLYQAGEEFFPQSDIIVPVPLHQIRLMKRRYNQAALLAH